MSKTKTAPVQASTPEFQVGQILEFKGYTSLSEGQEEILEAGAIVKVVEVQEDDSYFVALLSDAGVVDSAFDTELEATPASTKAEADFNKPAPAPKKGKKAPAATKPKGKAPGTKSQTKVERAEKVVAKIEKKEAKEAGEELEVLPPDAYSESVRKVTKTGASALKAAKGLVEKIGGDFWVLGGVLSFIRRNKSFLGMKDGAGAPLYDGNKGFASYVLAELGMEYRKAMYYIQIHETFAPLGIDESRLSGIGWSKVKELTYVVDEANVNDWLDRAEEMGRDDLKAEIKTSLVKAGEHGTGVTAPSGEKVAMTKLAFRLFADQGTVAVEALEAAKIAIGSEDDNAAFAHILSEWLSMNSEVAPIPLEAAIETLEGRYGEEEVAAFCEGKYAK